MKKLETIDGETLMSRPLQPLNFVVDTLISQGLHILAGSPKVGKALCIPDVPPCEALCPLLRRETGMYPPERSPRPCGLCGPFVGSAQLRHSRDAPSGREVPPSGGASRAHVRHCRTHTVRGAPHAPENAGGNIETEQRYPHHHPAHTGTVREHPNES